METSEGGRKEERLTRSLLGLAAGEQDSNFEYVRHEDLNIEETLGRQPPWRLEHESLRGDVGKGGRGGR